VDRAAVLVVLACVLFGCGREPERLEVANRLAETRSLVPLVAFGADGEVVGDDLRPSFDTGRQRPLSREGAPRSDGATLRQAFRAGPLAKGLPLVITRAWRPKNDPAWRELPPIRVVPADGPFELEFPVGEGGDPSSIEIGARAFLIPQMPRSRVVDDLQVVKGSILVGAFGLDPVSRGLARRPVAFRLVARSGDATHVLLEEERDPRRSESFRWTDFRIPLDRFAGRTIHLELSSALRLEPTDDPALEVSFPSWSVPTVVVPQAPDAPPVRNVILVSLDTLRADYVGAYGQPLPTTPNLDRFAAQGAVVENVYTTYPSTTASHMSMLTGLYPSVHGVYGPTQRVPLGIPMLAELLRARRYRTAAVTEDAMLAAAVGFPRGFDAYREYKSPERLTSGHVKEVVDDALAWLKENHRQRFFLFLHTYQVHGPHVAPPAYDVFTAQPAGLKGEFATARRGYAGDLLYTDAEIGRLLAGLEALGESERTVVLITADHGEELGEHSVIGHGWYVTDPVMRIPMLLRAPGVVPAGVRLGGTASLVDVTPTILELAGAASGPPPTMQGTSLVPWLADPAGEGRRDRAVYGEMVVQALYGVVAHRGREKWKVGGSPDEAPQFFDLQADPAERSVSADAAKVAEGRTLLERYAADNERTRAALGRPKAEAVELDDTTHDKLRALGYVE